MDQNSNYEAKNSSNVATELQPTRDSSAAPLEIYEPRNPNMPTVGWLVFNRNAGEKRKARAAFIAKFGADKYNEIIKPIEREGIMSIFNEKPTEFTAFYVNHMARLVDERTLAQDAATNA